MINYESNNFITISDYISYIQNLKYRMISVLYAISNSKELKIEQPYLNQLYKEYLYLMDEVNENVDNLNRYIEFNSSII